MTFSRTCSLLLTAGLGMFPAVHAAVAESAEPARIKRSEGYFGLHFDFHARDTDVDIGKNTTRAMIEKVLDGAKPDYVQIDCKGHKGYSSYPTKVGNSAPGLVGDPLRLWRQVTAERGIPLVMHYSGVIDAKAVADHPDWCVIDVSGKPTGRSTSLFGPYADELMIPQLKELARDYQVDAIWVDGDNWGVNPDYRPAAIAAFTKETGITEIPKKPEDPHWFEWMEFHRAAFRRFLNHYITEVKKVAPNCEIASNWAYTSRMPEAVKTPVDFLSGDLVPYDAAKAAPIEAHYLAGQGKPWDLMSWGFTRSKEDKEKIIERPLADLKLEAARALALGGGYQVYLKQQRDGSINWDMAGMAELEKFCNERKPFCKGAKQIPQVAFLLSTPASYREMKRPFVSGFETYRAPLTTLLMGRYSVELLNENRLTGRLNEYPLVVIPNWDYLDLTFRNELVDYVKGGGQLLLVGYRAAQLFQAELDVKIEEDPNPDAAKPRDPSKDPVLKIALGPNAQAVEIPIKASNPVVFTEPGASVAPLGKGRIAAIYSSKPIGPLLDGVAKMLFPERLVEVKANLRDVVVNRIDGKLAINLIGPDDKPQGPVEILIRWPVAPTKVTLQPANQPLDFKYEEGRIIANIPQLKLHDIVMVE